MSQQVPQVKDELLEETREALNFWRKNKLRQNEPTPDHIRALIKRLSLEHKAGSIKRQLGVGKELLDEICGTPRAPKEPIQEESFIPFRLVPQDKDNALAQSANGSRSQECAEVRAQQTKFEISNVGGAKLTIYSSDATTIIKAFLCCN